MGKPNRILMMLALVGSAGVSALAVADDKPSKGGAGQTQGATGQTQGSTATVPVQVDATEVTVSATVDSIDKKNHKLTLKDRSGEKIELQVAPDVVNLDKVKKGDPVDVTYYNSVAVALVPPVAGAPAPAVKERQLVATHPVGTAGAVAHEVAAAVPLTSVDANKGTISFKAPSGATRTVNVTDPQLKDALKDLKPGDIVAVTYTEAVATAINPSQKK
jgi:hypothetical protein